MTEPVGYVWWRTPAVWVFSVVVVVLLFGIIIFFLPLNNNDQIEYEKKINTLSEEVTQEKQARIAAEQKAVQEEQARILNNKDSAQALHDETEDAYENEEEATYDTISFKNECDENIYVAIHYAQNANTSDWITEGWWEISAHKKVTLDIQSYGASIDFFGMIPGFEWNGNNQPNAVVLAIAEGQVFSHVDGQDYTSQNLRQVTFRKIHTGKSYGDVLTVLSCKQ